MNLQERFIANWKKNFTALSVVNGNYIVAVSGGMDSSVLVDIMYRSNMQFEIAHCNFQLRGEESERDELFVKRVAEKYNKQIHIKKFDTLQFAEENKIAIQEAARILRYKWFSDLQNSNFLITAHNADDNIETFLMNASRGTGLKGLTGIPQLDTKRKIVRPLLFAFRKDIEAYAKQNDLLWVEDSSNKKDDYTRNFFRHQIIPLMQQQYSNAAENIIATIDRLKEVNELYSEAVEKEKSKLIFVKEHEVHIPVLKLLRSKAIKTLIWEIFKDYNFNSTQTNEILKLMHAANASFIQSSTHRIIKNRKWLIVAPIPSEENSLIIIEKHDSKINFQNGSLQLQFFTDVEKISTDKNIATIDASNIRFPLVLRKWKQGDYFYPLGMNKKKKLSRFFIDEKFSPTEKQDTWVLESDKRIIWIVGHRIDDRFKMMPTSKESLKIIYVCKH